MYLLKKFRFILLHIKNILPDYLLIAQDLIVILSILTEKNTRKNQSVFLLNYRSWGFGHQLLELRYARFIKTNFRKVLITTKVFSNDFLHEKMTDSCIKTFRFNFLFTYEIISEYLRKNFKSIDIGAGLDDLSYWKAIEWNCFNRVNNFSNHIKIYKSFPINNYEDLPCFFSKAEESNLFNELSNIGISENSWFCVIHIRKNEWSSLRNTNLKTFNKSIQHIYNEGGQVLLTGEASSFKNEIPTMPKNASSPLKLFALAKQKFMLASSSGPSHTSFIFNVPVIVTNNFYWFGYSWSNKDSSLPRLILNRDDDKLINFSQYSNLLESDCITYERIDSKFEIIDNSEDEILSSVRNKLNEIKINNFEPTINQNGFRSRFPKDHYIHLMNSKIDDSFYQKYKFLLEN